MLWQLGHRKWAWKLLGEGKYTAPASQGRLALANTLMLEVGKDETHQAKRKKKNIPPSHLPSQPYAYKGKPLTFGSLSRRQ